MIENPWRLAEHVGWTLLHSTWQLTLWALLCVLLISMQSTARARYRAAFSGLLLMAVTPIIFFAWLVTTNREEPRAVDSMHFNQAQTKFDVAAAVAYAQPPLAEITVRSEEPVATESETASISTTAIENPSHPSDSAARRSLVVWLVPLWVVGMLILFLAANGRMGVGVPSRRSVPGG